MKFESFTCVEASTAHISPKDNELLKNGEDAFIAAYEYEYGYFVYLSGEVTDEEIKKGLIKSGYSKEFIDLYFKAQKTGAKFLNLDCDSLVYDDLPKFEW